jgi:hypothetical protein
MFWLSCVVLILSFSHPCSCDQVEYELIHSILKDYNYEIKPSWSALDDYAMAAARHHNQTTTITFGLSLTQIIDVVRNDECLQGLKCNS